ncbi:cardiolipin synthase [Kushneria marisflavi]|uniref:Cardiolipin synthase n=1 Tax=Kushneria marisflavi TaxID=157779 RepID=A0A240UKQ0_9GAMM|nr:cardiolipin synthase [Kushneria marisflavi]ART61653.1 cardiolipin synthase [Kushneria marisflavi]RKD86663.1 cardiolipin synthase [Kushneria marisflavi]
MTALLGGLLIICLHLLGALSGLMALMSSRTSQGAIAWIICLITFPYLAIPAYWFLGRPRFYGYVSAREQRDTSLRRVLDQFRTLVEPAFARPEDARLRAVERLAMLPMTSDNHCQLLINGHATFESLFQGIEQAEDYVLIQFFIVRDDALGQALKRRLIECAERGVHVFFLYDEIGSHGMPDRYFNELRSAGVAVHPFGSSKGWRHRFQVNFRNHRKIMVADGRQGWVGGLNVGVEYRGESKKHGHWRDTHLKLVGPAVLGLQESFWEDWHWATGDILSLAWHPRKAPGDARQHVVIVPSGPSDPLETASLLIQHAINQANERFWVTSPYFVPDQGVQDSLKLAALRGVDVRVMMPERPDHLLVFLSAFSFLGDMIRAGVKIYRYQPGFLHQKTFLIDRHASAVGTVNLDNRSFRLNFEVTAYVADEGFAAEVAQMLEEDFASCRQVTLEEINKRPLWHKLAARAAYLASPIQ